MGCLIAKKRRICKMSEILIFFIFASIVINIVKAIGGIRKPQTRDTNMGIPTGPQEFKHQETGVNRTSPEYTIGIESPHITKQPMTQMKLEPRHRNSTQRVKQKPVMTPMKKQHKGILEGLTKDKLIEGIILSEILAAPKSKRR
jgi:hypothetical protein